MPTYVYQCDKCGSTLERRQSFSDAPLRVHDGCGGDLRRLLQPAPVIFKGSGFYTTDYRSSANGASSNANGHGTADSSSSDKTSAAAEKATTSSTSD